MAVPVTGYTELDLVGFTDKGTYNAATTYVANDLVSYNGIKWKCLQDGTVGVTPAEGVSWSVFIIDNEINDNAVSATSTWSSQKINTTKADQTAIAPVENGTTASRAYAIGEHFMKDGAFCTAIAAIAQGATFTLDTNYTVGSVGEIGKSGSLSGTQKNIPASTWTDIITKTFTASEYGTYIISAQTNNHNSDDNNKYIQIQGTPLSLTVNAKTTQLYQPLTGIFTVSANSPTVKLRAYSATASTIDNSSMVWAKL